MILETLSSQPPSLYRLTLVNQVPFLSPTSFPQRFACRKLSSVTAVTPFSSLVTLGSTPGMITLMAGLSSEVKWEHFFFFFFSLSSKLIFSPNYYSWCYFFLLISHAYPPTLRPGSKNYETRTWGVSVVTEKAKGSLMRGSMTTMFTTI